MADKDPERQKALITDAAMKHYGLIVGEWFTDEYGSAVGKIGRWRVLVDDEDRGLFEGDEGELHAEVVGAPENHNERVHFGFKGDDFEEVGAEVVPFEDIDAL
jgi:hypothetical protein